MLYRDAQETDAEAIALLHADSWRRTYRGLFSDDFLDNHAELDRINVWNQRLTSGNRNQFVFVAEQNRDLMGFVCVYAKDDPRWGSLIDNLHVAFGCRRQGIGSNLMSQAFAWLKKGFPDDPIYLWAMENNTPARMFYERLGASNAGVVDKPNPVGGGFALNCRYVWPRVQDYVR